MRGIAYWKKELMEMSELEYIDLLQAIQDHDSMVKSELED